MGNNTSICPTFDIYKNDILLLSEDIFNAEAIYVSKNFKKHEEVEKQYASIRDRYENFWNKITRNPDDSNSCVIFNDFLYPRFFNLLKTRDAYNILYKVKMSDDFGNLLNNSKTNLP
jgi:hypothetical protein